MRNRRFIVEPRGVAPGWLKFLVPALSVVAAMALGAIFLAVTGNNVFEVYTKMADAAFGSGRGLSETLVSATPLILTGLAAAIAFKMLVWNIGAEGQLLVGGIIAAGIAIALGDGTPGAVGIPLILIAGMVGGAAWAGFAAVPRVYLGTNEIITTLMLNFIAIAAMNWLVFEWSSSPWKDPESTQFPQGKPIADGLRLPEFFNRLDIGFFVAVAVAIFFWVLIARSRWGFGYRVAGDSTEAARYAGIKVNTKFLSTFLLSGGAAGLAGALLVAGILGKMDPRSFEFGLGFTGIIVAALARLNPLVVVPVAVLVGALDNAGPSLQSIGVPSATATMLQGAILLFAVAGEFFISYRIRRPQPHELPDTDEGTAPEAAAA